MTIAQTHTSARPLAEFLDQQKLETIRLGPDNTIVFRYPSAKADWMSVAELAFDYMLDRGANPVIAESRTLTDGKLQHTFRFDQKAETTQMLFAEIRDAVQTVRGIPPGERAGFPPRPLLARARQHSAS